eukprot:Skav218048  [mRNA]  locus=scaffold214:1006329:1007714:- [translate_table: standard]
MKKAFFLTSVEVVSPLRCLDDESISDYIPQTYLDDPSDFDSEPEGGEVKPAAKPAAKPKVAKANAKGGRFLQCELLAFRTPRVVHLLGQLVTVGELRYTSKNDMAIREGVLVDGNNRALNCFFIGHIAEELTAKAGK